MNYIDTFRNREIILRYASKIKDLRISRTINLMEVCGTHTVNFFKFGIDSLLPDNINIIAGPGCPVCVSEQNFIDKAVLYAQIEDFIVLSFGDLMRVPGTFSSLQRERAKGRDIRIVYSSWDALKIALDNNNTNKKILFLGVGFETTAPGIALTVIEAKKRKINNLFFLLSLKRILPVMEEILKDSTINIDGFICPGHVSTIIGSKAYEPLVKKYRLPCCIAGFEPLDIIEAIYILLKQITKKDFSIYNQYKRLVKKEGNLQAQKVLEKVFVIREAFWRGMGRIDNSGFGLHHRYEDFDIEKVLPLKIKNKRENNKCLCGEVLKGKIRPPQCPLYAKVCNPLNPIGPCMVSHEGACYAYYKYQRK